MSWRAKRPTARRLFRTTLITNVVAIVFGLGFFYACWAAADYDAELGRDLGYWARFLTVMLGLATLLYYPWGPTWAAANGCKPDDPPSPGDVNGQAS